MAHSHDAVAHRRPALAAALALALILAPALAPAPAHAASEAPAVDLWRVYKSFPRLTREPRMVSRKLAMLCIAPPPEAYEKDREQYGPHSMARVHVYANPPAAPEMTKTARRFPVGAIIVKEKLAMTDNATVLGIGAMQKMPPGYDPAGGDWKYLYSERPGQLAEGRLDNCRACHMRAQARDHVYFRADSEAQP